MTSIDPRLHKIVARTHHRGKRHGFRRARPWARQGHHPAHLGLQRL